MPVLWGCLGSWQLGPPQKRWRLPKDDPCECSRGLRVREGQRKEAGSFPGSWNPRKGPLKVGCHILDSPLRGMGWACDELCGHPALPWTDLRELNLPRPSHHRPQLCVSVLRGQAGQWPGGAEAGHPGSGQPRGLRTSPLLCCCFRPAARGRGGALPVPAAQCQPGPRLLAQS